MGGDSSSQSLTMRGIGAARDVMAAGLVVGCGYIALLLWAAGWVSCLVAGTPCPPLSLLPPVQAVGHLADPAAAWGHPVGPPWLYWSLTMVSLTLGLGLPALVWRRVAHARGVRESAPSSYPGVARRDDVVRAAGRRALVRRAATLRPSLRSPSARDVGLLLGRSRGLDCYSCVEDSVIVLGPPRAGKGLHLVIPSLLDAPGAVITTSTRPDNLTATLSTRARVGPVAVFDPQHLAPGVPSATRWSPIRGCEDPQTALLRARALTTGTASGTTDANFWQASAEQAVRCLLHAAALGGRTATDLYRWSLSPVHAQEAVAILATDPRTALAWDQALESIVVADQRQRDSVWAMVSIAFAALADPRVLQALSPEDGEGFDPEVFLRQRGTLYLLGTASGASATGRLVGALVEDVVGTARRLAAASVGSRLDPPLSLILDEAANYPLPSLPSLMSEGGGTGICTVVVLQSLAQARHVWGEHAASAVWDAAIVKVILGGGSTARDLEDLSRLIGQRDKMQTSTSTGGTGHRSMSTSTSTVRVPVLEPHQLRTLPFGTAVLLLRAARPIILTMTPWTARRDAATMRADRTQLEAAIQAAAVHSGGLRDAVVTGTVVREAVAGDAPSQAG
ncbi:MAG: TraM recognition domain-containing protein [Lapillicoccus sp.]